MVRATIPSQDDLIEKLTEKADSVGLVYDDVKVRSLNPDRDPRIVHLYEKIGIKLKRNVLVLYVKKEELNIERIEYQLEYLVSQEKARQEGIFDYNFFAWDNPGISIHTQEIHEAFRSYFTASYHIQFFEKDHFFKYHMNGLQAFVAQIHQDLSKTSQWDEAQNIVAALFKEQIKSNYLDEDPGYIAAVMKDIVSPFAGSFDKINNSDLDWNQKQGVIFAMAMFLYYCVDSAHSYLKGRVIYEPIEIPLKIDELLIPDGQTLAFSKDLYTSLQQAYTELAD